MSNGDSQDGFVFPPFVPPSASRPPAAPVPAPAAPAPAPPPSTVPRDEEPAAPEAAAEAFDDPRDGEEDLPWLELPEPRAAEPEPAPAPAAVAEEDAGEGVLPDWMTWDARAEAEAEAELADTPAIEGLEEFDAGPAFEAVAAEEPADLSDLAELAGMELEEEFAAPQSGELAAPAGADAGAEQPFAPGAFEDRYAAPPEEAAEPLEAAAEPDPFTAAEIDRTEAAEPAEAAAAAPGAFDEVAARLEAIARELRERPGELLSGGGDDPLALLVTGYVLGWSHARRG